MLKSDKRTIPRSPAGLLASFFDLRMQTKGTRALFYDLQTLEVMRSVLGLESTGIDVGAHEGLTLADLCRIAPAGRHYAFEPLPSFAEHLREHFPGVCVIEAAASDSVGMMSFNHVRNAPSASSLQRPIYDGDDAEIEQITVEVVRIDDVVPENEAIAFIKVDVDGGVYDVLRGARETIARCRPVIIFEASEQSTGQFGVTADMVYTLLHDELGLHVSTMRAWLSDAEALSKAAFQAHWRNNTESYFIAYA